MKKTIKVNFSFREAEKPLHKAMVEATDNGMYSTSFIIKEALREYLKKHNYLER